MTKTIPDDVKEWIDQKAKEHINDTDGDYDAKVDFKRGATAMYNRDREEIERLKKLIDDAYDLGYESGCWYNNAVLKIQFDEPKPFKQFKTENNLDQ